MNFNTIINIPTCTLGPSDFRCPRDTCTKYTCLYRRDYRNIKHLPIQCFTLHAEGVRGSAVIDILLSKKPVRHMSIDLEQGSPQSFVKMDYLTSIEIDATDVAGLSDDFLRAVLECGPRELTFMGAYDMDLCKLYKPDDMARLSSLDLDECIGFNFNVLPLLPLDKFHLADTEVPENIAGYLPVTLQELHLRGVAITLRDLSGLHRLKELHLSQIDVRIQPDDLKYLAYKFLRWIHIGSGVRVDLPRHRQRPDHSIWSLYEYMIILHSNIRFTIFEPAYPPYAGDEMGFRPGYDDDVAEDDYSDHGSDYDDSFGSDMNNKVRNLMINMGLKKTAYEHTALTRSA